MVLPVSGAIHAGFLSNAMPHFVQSAGLSDVTPGHIGQMNLAPEEGISAACSCPLCEACERA